MQTNVIDRAKHYLCQIEPDSPASRRILLVPVVSQVFFYVQSRNYEDQYNQGDRSALKKWKKLNETASVWGRAQYMTFFVLTFVLFPAGIDQLVFLTGSMISEGLLRSSQWKVELINNPPPQKK